MERQQRLCQRCEGSSVDDVEHMIFDCSSLEAERQKHQSLIAHGRVNLADFLEQDPIKPAAFVLAVLRHAMRSLKCEICLLVDD